MSFTNKSDFKNHLSPRKYGGIHLYQSVSQPDATGFSEETSESTTTEPGHLFENSPERPLSSERETSAAGIESASGKLTAPVTSKSPQP